MAKTYFPLITLLEPRLFFPSPNNKLNNVLSQCCKTHFLKLFFDFKFINKNSVVQYCCNKQII